MIKGYLIISVLLLSTVIAFNGHLVNNIDQGVYEVSGATKGSKETYNLSHSSVNFIPNSVQNKEANLDEIYSAIKRYIVEYGGLAPTIKGLDSYANSTFWGVLGLYLIGKVKDYSVDDLNFKRFIDYMYDEETGGFRSWLEGTPNIISTGYMVIVSNLTGIYPTQFNSSKTIQFITMKYEEEVGFVEYGQNDTNLITNVMASIALALLDANLTNLNLIDIIMGYYKSGYFDDGSERVSSLVKTYFAIKALKLLKYNLTQLKSSIATYLMTLERGINSTVKGFGIENATVFETGLVLDILTELNSTPSAELLGTYKNFVLLCYDNGHFTDQINSTRRDIFQIAGGILVLYSVGEIFKYIETETRLKVGDQVPIDLNVTEINVKLLLKGKILDYFSVYTNVSGELYYDKQKKSYLGLANLTNLDFGEHTILTSFHVKNVFTTQLIGMNYTHFRVGYNLTIDLSSNIIKPGQKVAVNSTVAFHNGTLVKEGELLIEVNKDNKTVLKKVSNNTGFNSIDLFIPNDTKLGFYTLKVYVNDTHGSDHTIVYRDLIVNDTIEISFIDGNKTFYSLGEEIKLNLTLTYGDSGQPIPETQIVPFYTNGSKRVNGTAYWYNQSVIVISLNITPSIPSILNHSVELDIIWDNSLKTHLKLFDFNITLEDLLYQAYGGRRYVIGEQLNISLKLFSNTTKKIIENATITLEITDVNETLMIVPYKFNNTLKIYQSNATLDPNIPAGFHNITVKLHLPFNWDGQLLRVHANESFNIEVLGEPLVIDLVIKPDVIRVNDLVSVSFKSVDNVNNGTLIGLKLIANISSKKENITVPVGEKGELYVFEFRPNFAGAYNVTISRISDKLVMKSLEIKVKAVTLSIYEILEPYVLGGLWFTSIMLIGAYIIVRYYLSGKISKRYLVRKIKKK